MKMCPVRVDLFHAEGRTDGKTDGQKNGKTDMAKLIVTIIVK